MGSSATPSCVGVGGLECHLHVSRISGPGDAPGHLPTFSGWCGASGWALTCLPWSVNGPEQRQGALAQRNNGQQRYGVKILVNSRSIDGADHMIE